MLKYLLYCCGCGGHYYRSEGKVRAMRRILMSKQNLRLPWSVGQAFQVM